MMMKKMFLAVCVSALCFASACQKSDPPEVIVKQYFADVANGDLLSLGKYLTPDGRYELEGYAGRPEVVAELEKKRPNQIGIWKDVKHSTRLLQQTPDFAEVEFTGEYQGRKATCTLLLFLINGEWKISIHSFTIVAGLQLELNQMKTLPSAAAQAEAEPAKAEVPAVPDVLPEKK